MGRLENFAWIRERNKVLDKMAAIIKPMGVSPCALSELEVLSEDVDDVAQRIADLDVIGNPSVFLMQMTRTPGEAAMMKVASAKRQFSRAASRRYDPRHRRRAGARCMVAERFKPAFRACASDRRVVDADRAPQWPNATTHGVRSLQSTASAYVPKRACSSYDE